MYSLSDLRHASALTQSELAAKVGVSIITIANWELAKAKPSAKHIRTLCEIFKSSIAEMQQVLQNTATVNATREPKKRTKAELSEP